MTFLKKIAAACAALASLALAGGANAAVLQSTSGFGGGVITDYSAAGLASFNLELGKMNGGTLHFVLEEADLLGPLNLSAMILNTTGVPLTQFSFTLRGIALAGAGSVTPLFGSLDKVDYSANRIGIRFAQAEPAELHFGNPLGLQGQADWLLSTAGLRAGDSFSITAQVPEPSTVALLLPMLCMASLMAARRRRKD